MGTHTFSAEHDARLEGTAAALLLLAAVASVIAFFPPEGRLLAPLHDGLARLLGGATFLVPLGLVFAASLTVVRRARPALAMPRRRRFAGLALLALALLAGQSLLGQSRGLVGDWLVTSMRELIGSPLTVLLIVIVLALGTGLALEVNPRRLIWFAKG